MRLWMRLLLSLWLLSPLLHADGLPFDLSGPKVDVHVKRGATTLPISEVPNLLPGDRLWIHPDLPESQATHFVLVVAFLRGSTNPPPPDWFTRVETWTREARDEGVFVTVPAEAEQALLFLAPETGGDFNTLRKAVQSEPGSFVRAAQDLQAASWERMRLETYLSDVKVTSQFDPAALKTRAEMAARSLGIKINESCFAKPADQQASCLSQNSEGMVLDDANAQSLVNQLASGSTLDLVNQLSSTAMAGGGVYSPYVGAIVDTAKILSSLHTAHFQYIPASGVAQGRQPEPAAQHAALLPQSQVGGRGGAAPGGTGKARAAASRESGRELLRAETGPGAARRGSAAGLCHRDGARSRSCRSKPKAIQRALAVDIPLMADPDHGGLIASAADLHLARRRAHWRGARQVGIRRLGGTALSTGLSAARQVDAGRRGSNRAGGGPRRLAPLQGETSVCVEKVEAQTSGSHWLPLVMEVAQARRHWTVTVPLKDAAPGPVTVAVYQYGMAKPDRLPMEAYDAAASLDGLTLSSGDKTAILKGTRLDEVAKAKVDGITLTPSSLSRVENLDQLVMNAGRVHCRALNPASFMWLTSN